MRRWWNFVNGFVHVALVSMFVGTLYAFASEEPQRQIS